MREDRFRFLPIQFGDATRAWERACRGIDPPDLAFGPEWRQPRPRAGEKYFLIWDDHHQLVGPACGDGPVGLLFVSWPSATTVSFGMGLWVECRGRGLGPDIRDAIYAFLFSDPAIHKLESEVLSSNGHSLGALHGRYGRSRLEGRQLESFQIGHAFYDRLLFGLLRDEWEAENSGNSSHPPDTVRA
jgi:RimJ/RimL family protein N-acetyltransferase